MRAERMAYVARRPCGCVAAVTVDDGDAAQDVAAFIQQGYAVDRLTCAEVREHVSWRCPVCRPRGPAEPQQVPLMLDERVQGARPEGR